MGRHRGTRSGAQKPSATHPPQPPPSPYENNAKSTENDGKSTFYFSDKGVGYVHREKAQAAKQHIIYAQTAMPMEVPQNHFLKGGGGGAKSGRTSTSLKYHLQP